MLTCTCLLPSALRQTGAVRRLGARTAYHWKTGGDVGGAEGVCNGTRPVGDTGRESAKAERPPVESVAVDSASEKGSASESMASDGDESWRSGSNMAGQMGNECGWLGYGRRCWWRGWRLVRLVAEDEVVSRSVRKWVEEVAVGGVVFVERR